MKNNSNNHNLAMLEIFYKDAGYLIRKFSPIFEELDMRLSEISGNYTKFRNENCELQFQYDVNRQGTGRTMVDVIVEKNGVIKRICQIVDEDSNSEKLYTLIAIGAKSQIPRIEVFKELFKKYLINFITNTDVV